MDDLDPFLIGFAVVLGTLATYKHRSNIRNLRNGTEHRFTPKNKKPPEPSSTSNE